MERPSIEEAKLEGPEEGRVERPYLAPRLLSAESPERVLGRLLRLRPWSRVRIYLTVKYRQIPSSSS
jgi:hypothetical protein